MQKFENIMLQEHERKSCVDLSTNIEDHSNNLQIPKQKTRRHSFSSFKMNNGQSMFEMAERRPTIISVWSNLSRRQRMERRNSRTSVTTMEFKQIMKGLGALVFIIVIFVIFILFFYHFPDYGPKTPGKKKSFGNISLKQLGIPLT